MRSVKTYVGLSSACVLWPQTNLYTFTFIELPEVSNTHIGSLH